MKIGINLPQFGANASPQAIKQVAQEAERLGCEGLWVQERLLRPTQPRQAYAGFMMPWPEAYRIVFDPIETLTYAAAATQRIKLGTSVIDALFHTPVVLGRRLASLDQFSGGRLVIGLGQGWSEDEFEVAGVSPTPKGARFEEFIRALLAVWGSDPVRFDGRFYRPREQAVKSGLVALAGRPSRCSNPIRHCSWAGSHRPRSRAQAGWAPASIRYWSPSTC